MPLRQGAEEVAGRVEPALLSFNCHQRLFRRWTIPISAWREWNRRISHPTKSILKRAVWPGRLWLGKDPFRAVSVQFNIISLITTDDLSKIFKDRYTKKNTTQNSHDACWRDTTGHMWACKKNSGKQGLPFVYALK